MFAGVRRYERCALLTSAHAIKFMSRRKKKIYIN